MFWKIRYMFSELSARLNFDLSLLNVKFRIERQNWVNQNKWVFNLIFWLISVNLELIHDLWVPNIYIYNLKSFKVIDVLSKLAGLWINNRKEIYYSQATHITFICPMLFDSFPLDTQVCKFQVSSIFSPFFICYCCTWCNFGSRCSVLHLDRKKNKKGLYNSLLYLVVIKICTLKETKKMCQWNSH